MTFLSKSITKAVLSSSSMSLRKVHSSINARLTTGGGIGSESDKDNDDDNDDDDDKDEEGGGFDCLVY